LSFYADSSATVAAVSAESATPMLQDWIAGLGDSLMISDWVVTETAAALSQKRRLKIMSAEEHMRAAAGFEQQFAASALRVPVRRAQFLRAAQMTELFEAGLPAGDALHLAIAEAAGATLVTLDKRQAKAGTALGVATLLL